MARKIIALVNNKGGVGKTTSAVNLAAGIAAGKRRVLLVDLDAQGSASLSLGLTRAEMSPGSAEVLLEGFPIAKAVRPSSVKGLDVLPGSLALASADIALSGVNGREAVLRAALKAADGYDFIVLDCPPSLGLLTVNALTAADYYIIPVTPDYLALEGVANLQTVVDDKLRAGFDSVAARLGILLTLADYRLNVTREIGDMIRSRFGREVFKTEIRTNVRLKEAPSFGKSVFAFDNGSTGAANYRQLVEEVMQRIKRGNITP